MPNNIHNELTILTKTPTELEKIIKILKNGGENEIDFNAIVPMSKDLDTDESSLGEMGYAFLTGKTINRFMNVIELITSFNNLEDPRKKEALALGKKYVSNIKMYGHSTWYDWAIHNWGTKWNAYETNRVDNVITFETAWDGVPELIKSLSNKFPKATFKYEFSDEDTGSNVGQMRLSGNEVWVRQIENGSNEAYELAFKHRPSNEEYYHKVNGQWEYNEDAE